MNSEEIQRIGIKACDDMLEQITAMQKGVDPKQNNLVSMIIDDIESIVRRPDYLKIKLKKRIADIDNLGLYIEDSEQRYFYGDNSFSEMYVTFDDYDEESRTVTAYPSDALMRVINDHGDEDIKVIVDMKWLIELTRKCFEEHGASIGYPKKCPHFVEGEDYSFPKGYEPTDDQRKAVDVILNNKLSYIWGAPGTGKTQYVLATSIIAYMKNGGRVAIIAPTNNSVEQVLRGVLKVLEKDDPYHKYIVPERDIIRLGAATSEFLKDYGELCEDKAIMQRIRKIQESNRILNSILFERKVDSLDVNFERIEHLYGMRYDNASYVEKKAIQEEVSKEWNAVVNVLSGHQELLGLVMNIDMQNLRCNISTIRKRLRERARPVLDITDYQDKSDDFIIEKIDRNYSELAELEEFSTNYRTKRARIMAMTPFTLMGRSSLFEDGGIIGVDHIFIDEAGYANMIQTMPVFMCGPPIAMLGDHMQLPPVCELDRDDIIVWATRENDDYMRYGFMWDQSVRYIERLLFGTIEDARNDYILEREPSYSMTRTWDLRRSHRFADNLARILDDCVYHNGIEGHGNGALEVICYDVRGKNPESRKNPEEMRAVTEYLKENASALGSFAVLTPYKDQRSILVSGNRKHEDCILTVHGSQGREWDTVIISVSDNSTSQRDVPLRFTSTVAPNTGLKVMNTAVSRAKRRLVIFCEYEFWKDRAELGDLLGMILADPNTKVKDDYREAV